ncbi:peptide/nickel transport system substrate-binding protein [Catenulispora sp. MAP5-51]|uniref:ABC transporter substrate-binding protein n=1 Tax=Catenulispora sp. MAP5-51 TaxID=3156298 RepID=UPI00351773E5
MTLATSGTAARRPLAALLAAGLALTLAAGCGSGKSGGASAGSGKTVLNVGMPDGATLPANNNPYLDSSFAKKLGYTWLIWEPLAMQDEAKPDQDPAPWLATKWQWAPDYSSVTLTVRDGVKWSDGSALTPDDVAYSFQIMKDHKDVNYYSLPITNVATSGEQVTVSFSGSQYVNRTKILSTQVINKKQWSAMADPSKDTVANPVGTGPYTIKTTTPSTVTVAARGDYWGSAPKVKTINFTTYSSNDTMGAALTSGAAEWSYYFMSDAKSTFVAKDQAHYKLYFPAQLSADGLWFNTTKKPWDNPHLRRAISMVINRADIFNQGEAGYFKPEISNITGIPTPQGEPYIADQYKNVTPTTGVDAAKKELTDNGFTYQGSTLMDPTGKPVTLTMTDPADWNDYQTDLEIIKDNLATIGINATVDKANDDAWFDNIAKGNFDAALHWTNSGTTPYDMYDQIMDSSGLEPIGTAATGDFGRYQNPAADAALKAYSNATDDASRKTAMDNLEQLFVQEMPMIPTSAGNLGAEYSTKNWSGWPTADNAYEAPQPTRWGMEDIVLHLTPSSS